MPPLRPSSSDHEIQAKAVWNRLWKKWTLDKPAAFGELLWEVFVVQFAALLDRLTIRRVIALIPIILIAVAYHHGIPLPPELMLAGDFLAYIDVFTVILLVGMLSRVTTILFITKQVAARIAQFADGLMAAGRRLDFRHGRARNRKTRKRLFGRKSGDDEGIAIGGFACA